MNAERGRGQKHLILYAASPLALGIASVLFALLGSSQPNHTPPPAYLTRLAARHFPLEISPDPIDFGVVLKGEEIERPLSLRNARDNALTLARVETSCPCITVSPVPMKLGPRQARVLKASFDPSSELDFEGGLSVQLTGYLVDGEVAFRTQVRLRAQDER